MDAAEDSEIGTGGVGAVEIGTGEVGTGEVRTGEVRTGEIESFNPWSVVNLVFGHLAKEGLHPVLGESGDPGPPARALLLALGIEPAAEGRPEVKRSVHAHLAEIRAAIFEDG